MQCVVVQQSEIDAEKWNAFVHTSSMGWAYFLYEMIGMDRNSSFKNISFAILDKDNNDEILMIQQLHYFEERSPKKAFLINERKIESRWGFVLKDDLPKKHFNKIKECYEQYIDDYIGKHHIKTFESSLPPLTQANIKNKDSINPLIFFNFRPQLRYTYVVDLSKSDDKMLADCEEATRRAVKKIEASEKYEIIEGKATEEDCNTFIKLHKETYTRTNDKSDIIADEYHYHMFFTLIPKGICRVFFLKEKETQEIVAQLSILIYHNTAYYWWGGSKNEKENGINRYLMYKVICIIRESFGKTGWFETGGAYPFLRNGKYKGLNDFKKSFGTILWPIWAGSYTKPYSGLFLTIKRLLQRA